MMTTAVGKSVGDDEHPEFELGLFALGALNADEEHEILVHLAECDACRTECDDLGDAALFLSLLPRDRVRQIVDSSAQPVSGVTAVPQARNRPAVPPRFSTPTLRAGAAWLAPKRTRLAVAAAILGAAIASGVGVGMWLESSRDGGVLITTVSATATNDATGATAAIQVQPDAHGRYQLQAIVVGLQPGVEFQLTATRRSGRTDVIFRGVAAGGRQTITATTFVPPDEVAFFTVAQLDGSIVVTVPVQR
jgi:hypothetical protein